MAPSPFHQIAAVGASVCLSPIVAYGCLRQRDQLLDVLGADSAPLLNNKNPLCGIDARGSRTSRKPHLVHFEHRAKRGDGEQVSKEADGIRKLTGAAFAAAKHHSHSSPGQYASHTCNPPLQKVHVGCFEGERKMRSRGYRAPSTLARDLASILATVAFISAVTFIALATVLPELPA